MIFDVDVIPLALLLLLCLVANQHVLPAPAMLFLPHSNGMLRHV